MFPLEVPQVPLPLGNVQQKSSKCNLQVFGLTWLGNIFNFYSLTSTLLTFIASVSLNLIPSLSHTSARAITLKRKPIVTFSMHLPRQKALKGLAICPLSRLDQAQSVQQLQPPPLRLPSTRNVVLEATRWAAVFGTATVRLSMRQLFTLRCTASWSPFLEQVVMSMNCSQIDRPQSDFSKWCITASIYFSFSCLQTNHIKLWFLWIYFYIYLYNNY